MNNGDGTVTDTSTGLMWQKTGSSTEMTWEQALAYCESLEVNATENPGGYSGWRLPTIKELVSLADFSRYNPTINTTYFRNTVSSFYWSSTTNAGNPYYAWGVDFDYGYDGSNNIGYNYVRAVRGGQSRLLGHLIILSPGQADNWDIGIKKIIAWDTQNIAGNVKISISRDGGKTYTSIADTATNNGSYSWKVAGPASVNCMIKIEPLSDVTKGTVQGLFTLLQKACDVNGDGHVDLADAIICLQVLSGIVPDNINPAADVNGDGKIGLAEAISALQAVAGMN